MLASLLALFIILPFAELYILLELSGIIGPLPTLAIVIITGTAGAALARHQGLEVIRRIRTEMEYGRMPGDAMFEGVLVLIGAILLLTPGILTDSAGFLLLIPGSRSWFKQYLKQWVKRKIGSGQTTYYARSGFDMPDH